MKTTSFVLLVLAYAVFGSCTSQKADQDFRSWAPTPPMGWNSWDCYGPTVEEHEVKANADYMADKLKKIGWEYIVVDIRWFVENDKAGGYNQTDPKYVIDPYGRYMPAVNRFPSANDEKGFKELADYIHKKGLKFGIHIMRGIPKVAVEKKLPIKGTDGITADQIYSTELQCTWLRDNYTIVADKPGAQEYYNSIFELYASWGVDFVKVDDLSRPYHKAEIELIRKAIQNCGRPIVLSTSPGATPVEQAAHIREHANMWRLVDDVWDTWPQISHLFDVCEQWYPYIGPGTWPDCDMLPLGRISIRGERGNDRMTRLTKDEQIALMSLWTIFRSPLMFGGDLPSNDDFTLSLLTNEEVLDVLKNSSDNRLLLNNGSTRIWVASDTQSSDVFAALFYNSDQQKMNESLAIYSSDTLTRKPGKQSKNMKVNIAGAKKLYLVVSNGGDGNDWDHADWIEPKLTGSAGTLMLTDLRWVKAIAGWGDVQVNKSVGGNGLVVNNKKYENGIGTHSNSVIEYDIPEGYNTFTATGGLDRECLNQQGATVQFHVFTQNPFGTEATDSIQVALKLADIGLNGTCKVRDLWAREDFGEVDNQVSLWVNDHGARMVRISQAK